MRALFSHIVSKPKLNKKFNKSLKTKGSHALVANVATQHHLNAAIFGRQSRFNPGSNSL